MSAPPSVDILPREDLIKQIKELKEKYRSLEETPDATAEIEYESALLGLEIVKLEQKVTLIDEEILKKKKSILKGKEYRRRQIEITDRKISEGDTLWDHANKKARIDNPGAIRLLQPGSVGGMAIGHTLLHLYRVHDGLKNPLKKKRSSTWRRDALEYYDADNQKGLVWCHATGVYQMKEFVKAAHIVPFFLQVGDLDVDIFGSRGKELQTPTNCLLFTQRIKGWFDKYLFVIVPIDYDETPITRWKIELVGKSILDTEMYTGHGEHYGRELDGKELIFLSENRPASRFLYFHFIMALVRMRDIQAEGWKETWARYFTKQPFPTPGNYLRKTMLLAINQHFQTTDVALLEGWIKGQGFEMPITLSEQEAARVAKRVEGAVQHAKMLNSHTDGSEDENEDEDRSDKRPKDNDEDDEDNDEDNDEGTDNDEDDDEGTDND
ncbi:hypothetical protein F4803DRAFT_571926 [Xylaria telfairii]|nr:hypothetical protein F4803DRAFT_571926 [Xylaria telfairii]